MSQHLVSLSLNDVIARFALSFALAMVVAYLHEFVTNAKKNLFFFVALVSISLIVTMLMITIDERLPRALGLFAALAIIRFRMPVKNIQDIIFIFFAIAVGISCGTGAGRIAVDEMAPLMRLKFDLPVTRFNLKQLDASGRVQRVLIS